LRVIFIIVLLFTFIGNSYGEESGQPSWLEIGAGYGGKGVAPGNVSGLSEKFSSFEYAFIDFNGYIDGYRLPVLPEIRYEWLPGRNEDEEGLKKVYNNTRWEYLSVELPFGEGDEAYYAGYERLRFSKKTRSEIDRIYYSENSEINLSKGGDFLFETKIDTLKFGVVSRTSKYIKENQYSRGKIKFGMYFEREKMPITVFDMEKDDDVNSIFEAENYTAGLYGDFQVLKPGRYLDYKISTGIKIGALGYTKILNEPDNNDVHDSVAASYEAYVGFEISKEIIKSVRIAAGVDIKGRAHTVPAGIVMFYKDSPGVKTNYNSAYLATSAYAKLSIEF